jgi:hypothetical protein
MTENRASSWWTQPRQVFSALGPEGHIVSAAVAGFNLLLFVLNRYLPEYLRVLGAAPWIIGLFGSTEIALALVYPYLEGEVPDWIDVRHVLTAASILASVGIGVWLAAPRLGHYIGLPAWTWIFVGLFLVAVWNALGLRLPVSTTPEDDGRPAPDISGGAVLRWLGLAAGFVFAAFVLVEVGTFVPSFQVILAVTTSMALTATILQDLFAHPSKDSTGATFAGCRRVLDDIRDLPAQSRSLLVGDTLVRFAHGMVGTFFVTVVTSVLRLEITLLGHHFTPSAFFGVLLAIEMGVAAMGGGISTVLSRHIGRIPLVLGNFLITTLFPIFLVTVGSEALVAGMLFAVFGLRRATLPVRRALITEFTGGESENDNDDESGRQMTESYRLSRGMVIVPSAVLGGVLYGINPQLAFIVATTVGLLGTWSFKRFLSVAIRDKPSDRAVE